MNILVINFSLTFDTPPIISKLDKENEIISGTVEFTAVREDEDCALEKMHVTEGRFDLKFSTF
jgi:hypothetical protein